MNQQFESITLFKSIAFSFLAFFIILVTIVVFVYLSRKKIIANKLKSKENELNLQKNALNLVIQAQEEERIRIARDLHDDISSKLNAVAMSIHILKMDSITKETRQEVSASTLEACKIIGDNSRRIAHNLMPPTLESTGLYLAIRELCSDYSKTNEVEIIYHNPLDQAMFDGLPIEHQIHLYRIIQELFNNTFKHAQAKKIKLVFTNEENVLKFMFEDDGIGLKKDIKEASNGIGLSNILSRARIIKALPIFHDTEKSGFKFELTFNQL